jgi:amino acid transporter
VKVEVNLKNISGVHFPRRLFLQRTIALVPLIAIVYFSTSGGAYGLETAISSSGPGMTLILLCLIPFLLSIPMALMSAELGSAIPLEGGYYMWVKIALGKFAGYMEAVFSWMAAWLDTALYPVIFVDYLSVWFPGMARGKHVLFSLWNGGFQIDLHWFIALCMMVPIAILNSKGAKFVGKFLIFNLAIVLVPIIALIVMAIPHIFGAHSAHIFTPLTLAHQSIWGSATAGIGLMIWSYVGYDTASTTSGEMQNPTKSYPKALLFNVPFVIIGYLLPMIAGLSSGLHGGNFAAWQNGDFASAGGILGGGLLKNALIFGALFGQIGLFSSFMLCVSRLPLVLAADNYLPGGIAKIDAKSGAPSRAIFLNCGIFAIFAALNFQTLIDADVLLTLFGLMLEFTALIVLRKRFPNMKRPYKIPCGWFGVIGVTTPPALLTVWMLKGSYTDEPIAFWIGIGLSVTAALAYVLILRFYKKEKPDAEFDTAGIDFGAGIVTEAII